MAREKRGQITGMDDGTSGGSKAALGKGNWATPVERTWVAWKATIGPDGVGKPCGGRLVGGAPARGSNDTLSDILASSGSMAV
ncbi:unnamed protein product [Ilex paraguariensis]